MAPTCKGNCVNEKPKDYWTRFAESWCNECGVAFMPDNPKAFEPRCFCCRYRLSRHKRNSKYRMKKLELVHRY